jgi:hypothetical protein
MSKYNNADDPIESPRSYPVIDRGNGPEIYAYGCYWPAMDDIQLELTCWRIDHRPEKGGLGGFRHLMKAHNIIWPHLVPSLHEWTFERFKEINRGHQVVTLAGGAGTAKSADVARYALLWWWAYPEKRTVLVASTTISALTKRIWSYIAEGAYKAKGDLPRDITISPPPRLLCNKRDQKHGIHGIALKDGQAEKTLADVIGIHPEEGLLFIVDESTDVTPAVAEVVTNLDSGGVTFQMILIGNSKSKLDPHGKLSKPINGWNSVDPDRDTKWQTEHGICLYSDCYKSPAVLRPDYKPIQFLITRGKIAKEEKRLGINDPKFWRFVRGFWPPEDITKTVLTLSMVEKFKGMEKAFWSGDWKIPVAGLDPAFTSNGDECILQFAEMGVMENGLVGLDYGGEKNTISIQLDSKSKEPINYQIVREVKRECVNRGIDPFGFGADTWGIGMGAGDIFEMEWSNEIHRIHSNDVASQEYVDNHLNEKGFEAYYDKATEMYFAMRTFIASGQIRGLTEAAVEEFCTRQYEWKGRKIYLERKPEYKKRMGTEDGPTGSPDRSDACAIVLEVAKRNGFRPNERILEEVDKQDWEKRWETGRTPEKNSDDGAFSMAWDDESILNSAAFSSDGIDDL